jgi:putative ABC transport system permease protein
MTLFDVDKWQEILHALKKNKLRTFLTAFGVFWGIFMLMIMLASGNGLRKGVMNDFGNFATNSAFVWTRSTTMPYKGFPRGRRVRMSNDDMVALRKNIPEIEHLAPRLQGWGGEENAVTYKDKSGAFTIQGDYPEYNLIDPSILLSGRFINPTDINDKRKVAVIGERVVDILFEKDEDPIGKYIKIRGVYFKIVGVFKPGSQAISFGGDKAKTIILPFTSLQKAYNFGDIVHYFSVTAKKGYPASIVEEKAIQIIKQRNSIHPDDKQAVGHFNIEKQYKQMTGLFTGISGLVWIVGIGTLLAGVIGVSNIMLVIVKERTKEIGIQRALGATPANVIAQIITESVFLTSFAGYFGLVVGVGVVELINRALANTGSSGESTMFKDPSVDFNIAVTALIILVISGALAGMIPASRAVKIRPIEALRTE